MALKLGIDGAYFRLGTQPAKVRLGSVAVQDVPGAPTLVSAVDVGPGESMALDITEPADNGGSPLLAYRVYVEDELAATLPLVGFRPATFSVDGDFEGLPVKVAAVNAVGEGPKSAPVNVT